ncbi:hypothetical protein [Granulicella sibirica]|uniref:Uncharacterized protein n=1 Tax=Granulicella sibirica TaxID=2479048 RepID=A0A4Q0T169_9BACT|nr:hypothetical protein [Granulicella sibirica]RXH56512.1 hypothetical protein GRAN_3369 [Granulicella sibirica]
MITASNPDRLYDLLPAIYRTRDAESGYQLRALLQVISEQVNLVDADIARLYDNWFIETCQDWVVPYIGDLVGYAPLYQTGEPTPVNDQRAQLRERILIPRGDVANTVRLRRRKGTLAVLEELASTVAGWPSRATEFYRLLSYTQNINFLHLHRGRTVDIREGDALANLRGPFQHFAHGVDIRGIATSHSSELYNASDVGVFVWRLKSYTVTQAPALCLDEEGPNCFLFSVLGNDSQLFNRPQPTAGAASGKLNFPVPITRRDLAARKGVANYYGDGKSIAIWLDYPRKLVPSDQIVAADLTDWTYRPLPGNVAVDPVLGRIAFPPTTARRSTVWVSYSYGFSADMGGGEYGRPVSEAASSQLYLVGEQESFNHINDAIKQWQTDAPVNAVIEITDSGVYAEPVNLTLNAGQTLQLRAANRKRPVVRLLNWQTSQSDDLTITGAAAENGKPTSWFVMDGIIVTGRGVQVQGELAGLLIRHCTLVPGWGIDQCCEPTRPMEASLELDGDVACVRIEHSILGAIEVNRDEALYNPVTIHISDSILDATSEERVAIGAPEKLCANAVLDIRRTTVFGRIEARSFTLAENSIFMGAIRVCRRQQGCMRFCYVTEGSRTPPRCECQPELVETAAVALAKSEGLSLADRTNWPISERLRVRPQFNSVRYGNATYCQLADACATEITSGADDQSEMGAFHDLYQTQRASNLGARLDEYTPAGMTAGIRFAS